MANVSNELSETVSKLVDLTKQLSDAKSDIKILNQEEKRLKENVKKHMQEQGIDTINLRKGKISIRKSVRKAGINKDAVKEGLNKFFSDDEAFDLLKAANDLYYILGASTPTDGYDVNTGVCGIVSGHAYSLISAFEIKDSNDVVQEKVYMIRNP